jgi:hypothetical protein
VDSYDTKGKSSLRVGKQSITRQHEAAAGGDRKRSERLDAGRPARPAQARRGTNVFRMPDDDEDEDIAEKPEPKAPAAANANVPDPKTVAEWFKPPASASETKDVSVKPVGEAKDIFKDSIARLEHKVRAILY